MCVCKSRPSAASRSLADLPLDILMEILFYLPFEDLENISKTCKTLRILSNESITYHRTLKDKSTASVWTKRLLFDFLHIIDEKEHLLDFIGSERISIVNNLRELQARFQLGTHVPLLTQKDTLCIQSKVEASRRALQPAVASGGTAAPTSSPMLPLKTARKESSSQDKDGMAYLQILQGFHRIATNSHKLFRQKNRKPFQRASQDRLSRPQTPDKKSKIKEPLSPSEYQKFDTDGKAITEDAKFDEDSPDSSRHSRSTSSVFSDAPRLSDLGWSYSDELKNLNNNTDSDCDDSSDSSSSSKYLEQLQRSKKVSDKKYLYEKLNSRLRKEHEMNQNKKNRMESPETLRPESKASKNRNCSRGYLVELERCNTPSQALPSGGSGNNPTQFLTRYQEHLTSPEVPTVKKVKPRKPVHTPHRRKLVALVTDDNRICYEKL